MYHSCINEYAWGIDSFVICNKNIFNFGDIICIYALYTVLHIIIINMVVNGNCNDSKYVIRNILAI